MHAKVTGLMFLGLAGYLCSHLFSNVSKLEAVSHPLKKNRVAMRRFSVSDLPYGKRVSERQFHETYDEGHYTTTVLDRIESPLPESHMVNDIDISNLMDIIRERFAYKMSTNTDSGTEVVWYLQGREDDEITVLGSLDGKRFDPKDVEIFKDMSIEQVKACLLCRTATCFVLTALMLFFAVLSFI